MGRPISLTDNQQNPQTWVNGVQYGLSSELLQINYGGYYNQYYETRTYNSRLQLTQVGAMQYTYSLTQNNGQITRQNDLASGEEVTYTYDSLSRLIGAVTADSPTVPQWGQAFTYDGFGNRTSASVTKGQAPHGSWNYDATTNRVAGYYDANGNLSLQPVYGAYTGYIYDVENRLVSVQTDYNPNNPYQTEQYAYAPGNKRVWRRMSDGTEELYLYGISGQKLGTYKPFIYNDGSFTISTIDTNLYFGSRMIVSRGVTVQPDRIGSNRAGGSRYFPYGEEQQSTAQDRDKFATYYRDSTTGLDYAQNRYYASTLGRFVSPDPYKSANGTANPQEWNQYAYVATDPINYYDPAGLFICNPTDPICNPPTEPIGPTGPSCDDFFGCGPGPSPPQKGNTSGIVLIDATRQQQTQFTSAERRAEDELKKKPDCAKLFGTSGLSTLQNATYQMGFYFPPGSSTPRTNVFASTNVGTQTVTINIIGNFFKNTAAAQAASFQTSLSDTDFRAFVLLHELGHLTGSLGDDTTNQSLSDIFNAKIFKDCFGITWTP
jgi:RHS repeat-associated protein